MPTTPPRSWSRRRWLGAAVGAATTTVLGAEALAWAPHRLTVTTHAVGTGQGASVRIVQLSDLHLRDDGPFAERVAIAVREARPDLLVLTGDAIDRAGALPLLRTFLARLPAATARLAILGNWEHWSGVDLAALRALYDAAGWQLLVNASTPVRIRDTTLLVTGLDDLVGGRPDARAALQAHAPTPHHLLLAHCPMHRDHLASAATSPAPDGRPVPPLDPVLLRPPLMLAGHTHGGQVAVGSWAPMRPQGSGRYVAGWYRDTPTALYVSRGIGTSVVPVRFGAMPEVAVFDWRTDA